MTTRAEQPARHFKAPSIGASSAAAAIRPAAIAGRRTTAPRTTSPTVSLRGELRRKGLEGAVLSQPSDAPQIGASPLQRMSSAPAMPSSGLLTRQQQQPPMAIQQQYNASERERSASAARQSGSSSPRRGAPTPSGPYQRPSIAGLGLGGNSGNAPIASDGWVAAVLRSHLPPPVAGNVKVTTTPVNLDSSLSVGSSRRLPPDTVSRAGSTTVLTIPRLIFVPEETTTFVLPAASDVGQWLEQQQRPATAAATAERSSGRVLTPRPSSAANIQQSVRSVGGKGGAVVDGVAQSADAAGEGGESRVKVVIRDAPATHQRVKQFIMAATATPTKAPYGKRAHHSTITANYGPSSTYRSSSVGARGASAANMGTVPLPSAPSASLQQRRSNSAAVLQQPYRYTTSPSRPLSPQPQQSASSQAPQHYQLQQQQQQQYAPNLIAAGAPSMRAMEGAAREAQRAAMREREYHRAAQRDDFAESLDALMHQNRKLDRAEARRRLREGGVLERVPSPKKSPRNTQRMATAAADDYCFLPRSLTPRRTIGRSSRLGISTPTRTPSRAAASAAAATTTAQNQQPIVSTGNATPRSWGGGAASSRPPHAAADADSPLAGECTVPTAVPRQRTSRSLPFGEGDEEGEGEGAEGGAGPSNSQSSGGGGGAALLSVSSGTPSQKLAASEALLAANEPLWSRLQATDPFPPPSHNPQQYQRTSPIRTLGGAGGPSPGGSRGPSPAASRGTTPVRTQSSGAGAIDAMGVGRSASPSPSAVGGPQRLSMASGSSAAPSAGSTAVAAGGTVSAANPPIQLSLPIQTPRALTRRVLREARTQHEGLGAAGAGLGMTSGPYAWQPAALVAPWSVAAPSLIDPAAAKRTPSASPAAPQPLHTAQQPSAVVAASASVSPCPSPPRVEKQQPVDEVVARTENGGADLTASAAAANEAAVDACAPRAGSSNGGGGRCRITVSPRLAEWAADAAVMAALEETSPRRTRERLEQEARTAELRRSAAMAASGGGDGSPAPLRTVSHSPVNLRGSPSPTRGGGVASEAAALALALSPQHRFTSIHQPIALQSGAFASSAAAVGFQHQPANYLTPTYPAQTCGGGHYTTPSAASVAASAAAVPSSVKASPQRSVILEERRLLLEAAGTVPPRPPPRRPALPSGASSSSSASPDRSYRMPTAAMLQEKLRLLGLPADTISSQRHHQSPPRSAAAAASAAAANAAAAAESTPAPATPSSGLWIPSPDSSEEGGDSVGRSPYAANTGAVKSDDCGTNSPLMRSVASHGTRAPSSPRGTAPPLFSSAGAFLALATAEAEGRAALCGDEATERNHFAIHRCAAAEVVVSSHQRIPIGVSSEPSPSQALAAREAAMRCGAEQQEAEGRGRLCLAHARSLEAVRRGAEPEGRDRSDLAKLEATARAELAALEASSVARRRAMGLSPLGADGAAAGATAAPSASPSRCLSEEYASPPRGALLLGDVSTVSTLHELSGIAAGGASPRGPSSASTATVTASEDQASLAGAEGRNAPPAVCGEGAELAAALHEVAKALEEGAGGARAPQLAMTSAEEESSQAVRLPSRIGLAMDEPEIGRFLAWLRGGGGGGGGDIASASSASAVPAISGGPRAVFADVLADAARCQHAFSGYTHEVIVQEACDDFGEWFGFGAALSDAAPPLLSPLFASLGAGSPAGGGGLFASLPPPRGLQRRRYPHLPAGTVDGVMDCFALQEAVGDEDANANVALPFVGCEVGPFADELLGADDDVPCGRVAFAADSALSARERALIADAAASRLVKTLLHSAVAEALAALEAATVVAPSADVASAVADADASGAALPPPRSPGPSQGIGEASTHSGPVSFAEEVEAEAEAPSAPRSRQQSPSASPPASGGTSPASRNLHPSDCAVSRSPRRRSV